MGHTSYDTNEWANLSMSTITLTVGEEMFGELKEDLTNLRKKFAAMASRVTTADRVYQMNCQLFPLTKISNSKKDS